MLDRASGPIGVFRTLELAERLRNAGSARRVPRGPDRELRAAPRRPWQWVDLPGFLPLAMPGRGEASLRPSGSIGRLSCRGYGMLPSLA